MASHTPIQLVHSVAGSTIDERIEVYAQAKLDGHTAMDSYAMCGYASVNSGNARKFERTHQAKLLKIYQNSIVGRAPSALTVLEEIMVHGKSETARVKAAVEFLDRCGLDKTTKISIENSEPQSQSELQAQLLELLKRNDDIDLIEGSD